MSKSPKQSSSVSSSDPTTELNPLCFQPHARRIIKIAIIPLLLVGICLCVNLRLFSALVLLNIFFQTPVNIPQPLLHKWLQVVIASESKQLSKQEKTLVSQYLDFYSDSDSSTRWAAKLHHAEPENKIYTAILAQKLALKLTPKSSENELKQFTLLLALGRQQDPDNALYDYLDSYVQGKWGVEQQQVNNVTQYVLLDRERLDSAMALYLAGQDKPFFKTYTKTVADEILRLLQPPNDILGLLTRFGIYGSVEMPYFPITRELTSRVIFYGEMLAAQNNHQEGEKYFHSWRRFLPHLQENSTYLIDILVCNSNAGKYLESAKERKDFAEVEKLTQVSTPVKKWKQAERDPNIQKYGGIIAGLLLPALHTTIPPEDLAMERYLSYTIMDFITLGLLAVLITGIVTILAIIIGIARLCGHKPFFVALPGRSYLKILIYGVLLPIGLWYIFNHVDSLGGRGNSFGNNLPRLVASEIFLLFIFPILFGIIILLELKKSAKNGVMVKGQMSFATYILNMLLLFVLLLAVTGAILRPLLNAESRYYITHDPLFFNVRGFSNVENQVTNDLSQSLKKNLQKYQD